MPADKYTTSSRAATALDLDKVILAKHATVAIEITIPGDEYLGVNDDTAQPVIAAIQCDDAAVSFVASSKVNLLGTPPTSEKNGKPIGVIRIGSNGNKIDWNYL